MLTAASWDFAPVGGEPYQSPKRTSRQGILDLFDRNVAAARKAIAAVKDDQVTQPWSLLKAGTPLFTMPRTKLGTLERRSSASGDQVGGRLDGWTVGRLD